MYNALTISRNQATLEYDTSRFRTLATNLVSGLTNYINDMSRYMLNTFTNLRNDKVAFRQDERLQNDVKKASYISLSEVVLPVPVGLNVPMLEYLDALENGQSIIDRIIPDVFKPAVEFFSLLLATPENLGSVTMSTKAAIKDFEKEYNVAKDSVSKCFITNDRVEYMAYGDLYARHADYITVQERFEDMSARMSKVPSSDIRQHVENLCGILDRLALRLRQDPETYAVNGINAKFISEITFSIAVAAEYYASHFFLIQTLTSVMEESNKKIKAIVK